ncbi:MAG: O-antigen ligase family protein [Elusimicrobia bacterium]|nr:O-antigen ligase family protein [Elusimicrobiota bacterium]
MILFKKSSAWLLALLQGFLTYFLTKHLGQCAGVHVLEIFQGPGWFIILFLLNLGLTLLLILAALWKHEVALLILLVVIHTVCPILFFTSLTRNPYFTQIILFNIWIAYLWIVYFFDGLINKKLIFPKTLLDIPLFSFLALSVISLLASFFSHESSFYSSIFSEGIKSWIFLIVNVILVFYAATLIEPKWRRRFILFTFWVGALSAFYGLMQSYGFEIIWKGGLTPFGNRPVSTFGNPNFLSSYLLLLFPLLVAQLCSSKLKSTFLITSFLLILITAGIIATMTRSTWVGLVISIFLLPLSPSIREFIKKNIRTLAIFFGLAAFCMFFWPKSKVGGYANPWERIIEIQNVKNKQGYGPWHQRILIWTSCWSMVKDHPFLGKGWGLLELFYPYYQGKSLYHPLLKRFRTHANNAHNEVIEIWSQTGFIGMGIYLWIWVALIFAGWKVSQFYRFEKRDDSLWSWALTVGSIAMFTDNFFGNVSLHFTVPAFLFWWQSGLLMGMVRNENIVKNRKDSTVYCLSTTTLFSSSIFYILILFLSLICVWNFKREFQEIYYFRGFKVSQSKDHQDLARRELESAWKWYPREVNTNYELANTYSRLAQQNIQSGLNSLAQNWRFMAIWAYLEALRANAGYDEIYFNLAATQSQMGWFEDKFSNFSVLNPRGIQVQGLEKQSRGAIYNYSRALAINPLSKESYNLLGNVYLQNLKNYLPQGVKLYEKATTFFPEERDFWVNKAYFEIQSQLFDQAYLTLKTAQSIDPFHELTRRNIKAFMIQTKRKQDPLIDNDQLVSDILLYIQAKDWNHLKDKAQELVNRFPNLFQARFILANTNFELKQWREAENQFLKALEIEPNHKIALSNLALTYRSENRFKEARNIYERILNNDSSDVEVKNLIQSLPQ